MTDRSEILRRANQHVATDRAATHGDAENSFENIAALWSWWLDRKVTAHDVAMMMGLFKDARIKSNPAHADSYEDGCGYRAIAGELAIPPEPEPPKADVPRYSALQQYISDPDKRHAAIIRGYAGLLSADARQKLLDELSGK